MGRPLNIGSVAGTAIRIPMTFAILLFLARIFGSGRPDRETRSTVPRYGAGPAKVEP
jgi:hypothetical protein